MLGGQADLEVVGEAGDGRAGVARCGRAAARRGADGHPDARLNGLEATRELLAADDPPRVIVLTTFDADEYVVEALAAGADGFLLKDTPPAADRRRDPQGRRRRADAVADGHPHAHRQVRRRPPLRPRPSPPRRADRPRARGRAGRRPGPQQRGDRRASSTSRCRPSRRTCRASSTSSASPTACRSPSASTTRVWPDRPSDVQLAPAVATSIGPAYATLASASATAGRTTAARG